MSHPNPSGNGCSLEDCLTNLFALTDLCGIKWRRLTSEPTNYELLDDPVLVGFSRCIKNDILCVWRRVQRDPEQRQPDFNSCKELWIFWYGEEPESLRQATSDLCLKELESGTWDRDKDKDNGLTYECRTLLFKALHNLIERSLLSKNFVRLGRWYVLPYEHGCNDTGVHLSFCFHYFLHGESQVCASIEVKLRPPVWRLTNQHIALVQDNQASIQVILAPHGLSGILTGVTYSDIDHNQTSSKIFADWANYYPIKDNSKDEFVGNSTNKLPNMVEVIVGGTRLRYPTCYVLVCDNEELNGSNSVLQPMQTSLLPGPNSRNLARSMSQFSPPSSPGDPGMGIDHHGMKIAPLCAVPGQPDSLPFISDSKAEALGYQLAEKVRQDACLNIALNKRLSDVANTDDQSTQQQSPVGVWNFSDPAGKVHCNCVKHRKKAQGKGALGGKHGKGDKNEKLDRQLSRLSRNPIPFHRRGHHVDDLLQFDVERMMTQPMHQPNPAFSSTGATTITSSSSSNTTPQGRSSTPMHDTVMPMDTPNSAPSPLDEPQPPASSSMDPTMPTLSPHPPSKFLTDGSSGRSGSAVAGGIGGGGSGAATDLHAAALAAGGGITNGGTTVANCSNNGNNSTGNPGILGSNLSVAVTGSVNNLLNSVNIANNLVNTSLDITNKMEDPAAAGKIGTAPSVNTASADPQQFSWSSVTSKTESISHWVNSHHQRPNPDKQHERLIDTNLKRPSLPTKGSDSDTEQGMDSLYDFEWINMWIHLPLKKGRFESLGDSISGDLGAHSSNFSSHSRSIPMVQSPSQPDPDPYEFSDEASKDPKTLTTRSRPSRDERPSPLGKMEDESRASPRQGTDVSVKDEPANEMGHITSPLTPGGSLTRERDIRVVGADQDLLQIFQSDSSEEDDDGGAHDSGVGSKSTDDLKPLKMNNGTLGIIPPLDLGRMYPTPPSHETNKSHSPETMTDVTNEGILTSGPIGTFHSSLESTAPSVIDPVTNIKCDVFVPPIAAETIGASKYSAVDLPSGRSSPLPNIPEYKSSWSFPTPLLDSQHSQRTHYVNLPSVENISSIRTVGSGAGIDASPAIYSNSQQRTPLSYELTSPASNSSSYLNKTNNSIDNHGTNSQLPEAHSLLLNVLLCDSILNLFKDHNFDSCTICVCNADINGSDVSVYLPDTSKGSSSGFKCSCAFSAAVNRRFGYNSGLFYEDEVEITGFRHELFDHRKAPLVQVDLPKNNGDSSSKSEDITPQVMNQLLGQYASPFISCIGSHHINLLQMSTDMSYQPCTVDILQIRDANDVVSQAIEVAKQAMDNCSGRYEDHLLKINYMHKWPYLRGPGCVPHNTQDTIQCLKSLHPILQTAIQNKRVTRLWENTYTLQGPISWKDFHDLAGRGTEENHEPQPIPHFLVGHDRDWLTVSPYSIRYWDKQFLEPYGRMRDVLYVVVAPDNDFILQHVVAFFKELSTVYEMCRLGRHCAINKPLREGVLRVGKQAAARLIDEPVEDWFNFLGESSIASKLKLYAQVCKHNLGPILSQPNLDKSMFDQGSGNAHKAQFKMPEPASNSARPATPDNLQNSNSSGQGQGIDDGKDGNAEGNGQQKDGQHESGDGSNEDNNPDAPGIVVYIVDPFSYGQDSETISRLAMIGLLRCYQQMALPENLANNLSLQLVPLRTILEHKDSANKLQTLKSVAFSVFTSCKWNLGHSIMGRSLTGFGPAAAAEQYLKRKGPENFKLYSPPYILASTKSRQNQIMEAKSDQQSIVFCGYCLSEDQRWLLAVCTDEKGELMEHCTINIEIPNRNRRKKASARRPGLQKLWDFILGVVSLTCYPTRLVIGRFGRMGHGELKGWSGLLSKKNLHSASRRLKDMCGQCSVMGPSEVPCVLSVCLTSIETHPSFQVVADAMKQEEKQSSSIPLQTPRDASVTHILVFPTSATAQVNANPLQQDPQNDLTAHFELDDVFSDINNMGEEINLFEIGLFDNFDNANTSPPVSPISNAQRQNSRNNGPSANMAEIQADPQDDFNLLQQPLAMGYYISTAPPGPLPKWFWSACPENEFVSPHVFKSALHIHESSRHDEFLHKSDNRSKPHALDSHMTCDVLRYVLENYNSLSWLTFDPVLNDRRSCLPVHFVVLMQLYHALHTFV
ncbi:mediator of RNA polymerase II transcription subunit 13-like isoform X2 [Physella acuta]|uniref:mediator of RNA polymerase II transcription subunit 13-like isoform X2 n=1 Tax=Physella acuta TaxID=109671 RepID=UPI0027DCFDC4|nr:mediator of RNA polymerase II transcription subunit 13-like isoform X2 [Physella acuta]